MSNLGLHRLSLYRYPVLALVLVSLFGLVNCAARSRPSPPAVPPTAVFISPSKTPASVQVEIADSRESRERGLMGRTSLDEDRGMLFIMPFEADHPFWMKDTLIPLDMIFISRSLKVVGVVENAEPLTETVRSAGSPSSYVVEVNGGYVGRHGIRVGTTVRFDNVPSLAPKS